MDREKVIPFNYKQRLIEKAIRYLDQYEFSATSPNRIISTLIKAVKVAEKQLKHRIISLLGSLNRPEMVWNLYQIMIDEQESEDVRHHASIQLNTAAAGLEDPQTLIKCLTEKLNHPDPFTRALFVFALGWEGNTSAAIALIEKCYDPDVEVQQVAIDALTNLGDQRIFSFLVDRLENAPVDQKKVILYNLASFTDYHDQVIEIYNKYLEHEDPELRCDALAVMGSIAASEVFIAAIQKGLKDPHRQVKTLCLENLSDFSINDLLSISSEITALTTDPEPAVRQAAEKLLTALDPLDLNKNCERYSPTRPSLC
jgi:hypothetical protein